MAKKPTTSRETALDALRGFHSGTKIELSNDDAKLIMRHIVGVESPIDGRKWKGIRGAKF